MRTTIALIPPLPFEARKKFNSHKISFQKRVQRWEKDVRARAAEGPRKERLESTYCETIKRLIELLAWQFKEGNMRADGYFFTTYHGMMAFEGETKSKKTIKRHLAHLLDRNIIKDIDFETQGPAGQRRFRYGFWVRMADWIVKELIEDVSEIIYETKLEILRQEKQQAKAPAPQDQQPEHPGKNLVKEKIELAVQSTTARVVKHIEQRGNTHTPEKLISYYVAKNAKNGPPSPPNSS